MSSPCEDESEGSVYFDVAKYNKDYHYGKLSGRNLDVGSVDGNHVVVHPVLNHVITL